ncbi:unnamed protein product [Soboliphyme baturini]|uniref:Myosin motor domain-containing protein n=1 Tax=Soboliphyme baturini TaxID=241478 RepID=A0A183IC67_9BILA|nr:unnamed protein product [Soboliphyme baturini]
MIDFAIASFDMRQSVMDIRQKRDDVLSADHQLWLSYYAVREWYRKRPESAPSYSLFSEPMICDIPCVELGATRTDDVPSGKVLGRRGMLRAKLQSVTTDRHGYLSRVAYLFRAQSLAVLAATSWFRSQQLKRRVEFALSSFRLKFLKEARRGRMQLVVASGRRRTHSAALKAKTCT